MKRTLYLIIGALFLLIILFGVYNISRQNDLAKNVNSPTTGNVIIQPVITEENLNLFLKNQQFVKDLPDNTIISLRLYNFDSGEREWETDYTITKDSVEIGKATNPDVEMIIHSKYLSGLGSNICLTLQKAKANGDLGIDTSLSKTEILWKFRTMLKYRDCLGI